MMISVFLVHELGRAAQIFKLLCVADHAGRRRNWSNASLAPKLPVWQKTP